MEFLKVVGLRMLRVRKNFQILFSRGEGGDPDSCLLNLMLLVKLLFLPQMQKRYLLFLIYNFVF